MRPNRLAYSLTAGLLGLAGSAHAGGLFVGESGSQAMERAGAFAARADDPTAILINPAGLAKTEHLALYAGSSFIDHNLSYTREGTYSGTTTPYPTMDNQARFQPVPFVAGAYRVKDFTFALGVFGPQATPARDFSCNVPDNCPVDAAGNPAPQRFDNVNQKALIMMPSVAVAYRVMDKLDVGVRFAWGMGSLQARSFTWTLINPQEDPGYEGDFSIDVKDNFIPNLGVGVLFRPTSFLEIGAAYSTQMTFDGKGTGNAKLGNKTGPPLPQDFIVPVPDDQASCAPGGTAAELKACLTLIIPMHATVGARYIVRDAKGAEKADVELDVKWENWSAASDITVVVDGKSNDTGFPLRTTILKHGFKDVIDVRLGGSYRVNDALELRGGIAYDTGAAPTSWTRVDIDGVERATLALGGAYDFKAVKVDLGLAYVYEPSRTVTQVDLGLNPPLDNRVQPDPAQPLFPTDQQQYHPINNGSYSGSYFMALVGVTAKW